MKKALWFCLGIGLLQIVASCLVFQYLPERVPTHWNVAGEIDGWGGRWSLFLPSAITILISLLLYFMPSFDPKGVNIKRSGKGYPLIMISTALLMAVLLVITIYSGLGYATPVDKIIPVSIGIMFIIIGNYLPQAKQNYSYGIRLPWTLNNEEVWTKTHRIGGIVFAIDGLLFILGIFLPPPYNFIVPFAGLFIGLCYTGIYSYYTYKKITQQ